MKEVTISTEFMSEVMGGKVKRCSIDGNLIHYDIDDGTFINKYEFMHRCKEYMSRYFLVGASPYSDNKLYIELYDKTRKFIKSFAYERSSEEFEAVIKATQWVIDQKEK